MSDTVKGRDRRFDFIKGMLILGVLLGHCITALRAGEGETPWLHIFVRTYDMPMFAFVSGVFLRKSCEKYSTSENILNKFTSVFCPVIIWNLLYSLITRSFTIWRFWYLWSIVICMSMIVLVHGITKKAVCLRLPLLLCCVFMTHAGVISVFDNNNVGFLLFPCIVGYYFSEINKLAEKAEDTFLLKAAVFILFCLLLCFWNTDWNVWNLGCNVFASSSVLYSSLKMTYRAVLGILGCFSMKMIFDLAFELMSRTDSRAAQRIVGGIEQAGKHTMEIYILQSLLVETYGAELIRRMAEILGRSPFVFNTEFLGWFLAPSAAIVSCTVCYYIQKWLRKIPFAGDFIFGGTFRNWKKKYIKNA